MRFSSSILNDGRVVGRFSLRSRENHGAARSGHRGHGGDDAYAFCNADHDIYHACNACTHDVHNGAYAYGNACNHDARNGAYDAGNVCNRDDHNGVYSDDDNDAFSACDGNNDGALRNAAAYSHTRSLYIQQQYSTDNRGTRFCQIHYHWLAPVM